MMLTSRIMEMCRKAFPIALLGVTAIDAEVNFMNMIFLQGLLRGIV